MIGEKELKRRFTYHPPVTSDQVDSYQRLRELGFELAMEIDQRVPDSREKSTALTKLEEAIMHANAGIARGDRSTPREAFPGMADDIKNAHVEGA